MAEETSGEADQIFAATFSADIPPFVPAVEGQSAAIVLNEFLSGFPQSADGAANSAAPHLDDTTPGIWCEGCGRLVEEPCWEHAAVVEDDFVDLPMATLPPCLVAVRKEESQEIGVFARTPIGIQHRFGPVVAPVIPFPKDDTTLVLPFPDHGKKNAVYFDLADSRVCNWMKFVRFADNKKQQNLSIYLYNGAVYFVSIKAIAPGCELKVDYSESYAALLTKKFLNARGFKISAATTESAPQDTSVSLPQEEVSAPDKQTNTNETSTSVAQMETIPTPTGRYSLRRRQPLPWRRNLERDENPIAEMPPPDTEPEPNDQEPSEKNASEEEYNDEELDSEPEYTAPPEPKKPGRKRKAVAHIERLKVKKDSALLQNLHTPVQRKPRTRKTDTPSFLFRFKHSCKDCGLHFRSEELLQLHNLMHLPEDQRGEDVERTCPKCGIVRRSAEIMVKHVRQHARTTDQLDPDKQKCPFCHKYYVHLRSHLDLTHRAQYRQGPDLDETGLKYQCEVCQLRFRTIHGLKSHSQIHVENGPKLSQCLICNEQFKFSELQKHTETHVVDERFPCRQCTGTYPTYKSLTRHVQAAHDPSKVLVCELCQKIYVTRSRLNRHMLSHSNTFAFICDHCGKQFKIKQQMQRHIERVHLKINTEKLRAADKEGEEEGKEKAPYLRPRLRMAFEEFPYKCQECSLGYLQRGKLVNHVLTRHPETNLDDIPA